MEEMKAQYRADLCLTCGEISCTLNYDEALNAILEAVHGCLQVDGSSVVLYDPFRESFTVAAVRQLSPHFMSAPPVPLQEDPTGREILQDRMIRIRDLEPSSPYCRMAAAEGFRSALIAPLKSRGKAVGAIWVFSKERREFTPEEASSLNTLASQGGVTLGNARQHRDLHLIAEVGRAVTSRLDLKEILRLIVESSSSLFGAKGAAIYLTDTRGETLEVKASYGLPDTFFEKRVLEIGDAVRECLQRLIVITDPSRDASLPFPEHPEREGLQSVICAPLRVREKPIGVLRLYMTQSRDLTHGDRVLIEILADFSAIAIENARLYNHIRRDYEDLTRDVWQWYDWGERPPKM